MDIKPKTFVFILEDEQIEIVAMDFQDACRVFANAGRHVTDLLSVEEHSEPDEFDTIH